MKEKKKFSLKDFFILLFIIVLLSASFFFIHRYYNQTQDIREEKHVIQEVKQKAIKPIESLDNIDINNKQVYEEYKEVDWNYLFELNSDTIGWIRFLDNSDLKDINFPITQTDNNTDYLYRPFTYKDSPIDKPSKFGYKMGTIFYNFRNSSDFTDLHSTLYGHMFYEDDAMQFSPLKNFSLHYFTQEELNKKANKEVNQYFQIYKPNFDDVEQWKNDKTTKIRTDSILVYKLFGVNEGVNADEYGGYLGIDNKEMYNKYIMNVIENSNYDFKISKEDLLNKTPSLLTLYTCRGNKDNFYNFYNDKRIFVNGYVYHIEKPNY